MHVITSFSFFCMVILKSSSLFAQTEQIQNGDFSGGSAHWNLGQYGGTSSGSVTGGEYRILVSEAGSEHWHVQFTQSGLALVQGKTYEFRFNVYKGSTNAGTQTMQVNIGQSVSPYTSYFENQNKIITLPTTKTSCSFTFTMTHASDYDARIEFNCGKSTGGFYLDNISLKEQTSSGPELMATPAALDFGKVVSGNSYPQEVALHNNGNAPTTIHTVNSSSVYFSSTLSIPVTVPAGGTITLPVLCTPDADGTLKGNITIHSSASDNPLLTIPCQAFCNESQAYVISVGATAGGTVAPEGKTTVFAHESFTVTVTPASEFKITEVMVDGEPVGPVSTYTFTDVTSDHSVVVTFSPIPEYTITVGGTLGGTLEPSGKTRIKEHGTLTCSIAASAGFKIEEVLVDGIPEGAVTSYTFPDITSDHSVIVTFTPVPVVTITASAAEGGDISPSGSVKVSEGVDQKFTFTPDIGYKTSSIIVDGKPVSPVPSYTFTNVTENHSISVSFTQQTHTVSATATPGGTITPSGAIVVPHGGSQEFTFQPDAGYEISEISVDGTPHAPAASYTFSTVTASHSIEITFSEISSVVYQINCGSSNSAAPYSEDVFVSGGTMRTVPDEINISTIYDPAPEEVYKSERYGNCTYSISGLSPAAEYHVRLHFAELYWSSPGKRVFDAAINGITVLEDFDIFSAIGSRFTALIRNFQTTSNTSGTITISFTTKTDNATIEGIEIIEAVPNEKPTVKKTAAASPSPVTGISTQLSVQGADDKGEENLIYTWSAVGSSPAEVVFSENGTNSAKNCTAIFSRSGTYPLQVTITDKGYKSVISSVDITIVQTPSTITVFPENVTVVVNSTQQFIASVRDQFGVVIQDLMSGSWVINGGGTITSNGVFTAGGTAGGPYTVTALFKSFSAQATCQVVKQIAVVYQINCGNYNGYSPFTGDQFGSGGTMRSVSNTVKTESISNPAPQNVYHSERYGNSTYTITGLTPGSDYTTRLHFAELYWSSIGKRLFNVQINGNTVLSQYDLFAETGERYKASVHEFMATANSNGTLRVDLITITDNATICGLELLE